jgi:hypothetical protein
LNFPDRFSPKKKKKTRPVGAELFHASGRTEMTKLKVAFLNFATAPKNATLYAARRILGFEAIIHKRITLYVQQVGSFLPTYLYKQKIQNKTSTIGLVTNVNINTRKRQKMQEDCLVIPTLHLLTVGAMCHAYVSRHWRNESLPMAGEAKAYKTDSKSW